ncbi:hypothetical protein D0C36_07350 [Mucilaginibacter conchicola]|uniref:Lipoprotein n=1 Tax=Mucilaginibacter conchicola TaxID=2303333 RepID=A0A372P0T2_9SPHI|nr:hypothetical protein [Mucilaginibacter conchicola]RFZ95337.1 hypothetical protein D0C36_07350 [Mucilaginibacter conchicola]
MKQPLALLVIFSLLFASCKKDKQNTSPQTEPTRPDRGIEAVTDSVSFTVNGVVYNANTVNTFNTFGNGGVNQKLIDPNAAPPKLYELSQDPDSVLYFKSNKISSDKLNFEVSFLKKYLKTDMVKAWAGLMYDVPSTKEMLTLFDIGKHPYSEDFHREQNMNGIALQIYVDGGAYVSYCPLPMQTASKLEKGFQKGNFEIISLVKNNKGGYNLEATFDAQLFKEFDENDHITAEKGYLRLNIH